MSGLRKRQPGLFVPVPRGTARDRSISFMDRGVLTYILDQPEGWEPSVERISAASDLDGRSSVAASVRRLRARGYYRVERRRLLNGQFETGAAVSAVPVEQWAREHEENGGKPVTLVQQPDGSYLVLRRDGTTAPDGFGGAEDSAELEVRGEAVDSASPQVTPEAGFPSSVEPNSAEPNAEQPESENPPTKREEVLSLGVTPEKNTPPTPPEGGSTPRQPKARPPREDRGTRLPAGWMPSRDLIAKMRDECPRWESADFDLAHRKFTDYWTGVPGAKGRKVNWDGTWRNWVREEYARWSARNREPRPASAVPGQGMPAGFSRNDAALAQAARRTHFLRIAEEQMGLTGSDAIRWAHEQLAAEATGAPAPGFARPAIGAAS